MASAAITIVESPATIESDTNEAVITKDPTLANMEGFLHNRGSAVVFCKVSVTGAASGVATTNAQAQLQFSIPANSVEPFDWLPHYVSIAHKTASGTSVLNWIPRRRID